MVKVVNQFHIGKETSSLLAQSDARRAARLELSRFSGPQKRHSQEKCQSRTRLVTLEKLAGKHWPGEALDQNYACDPPSGGTNGPVHRLRMLSSFQKCGHNSFVMN
jgi:hypothetical protein